jgi:hypothetical protein
MCGAQLFVSNFFFGFCMIASEQGRKKFGIFFGEIFSPTIKKVRRATFCFFLKVSQLFCETPYSKSMIAIRVPIS